MAAASAKVYVEGENADGMCASVGFRRDNKRLQPLQKARQTVSLKALAKDKRSRCVQSCKAANGPARSMSNISISSLGSGCSMPDAYVVRRPKWRADSNRCWRVPRPFSPVWLARRLPGSLGLATGSGAGLGQLIHQRAFLARVGTDSFVVAFLRCPPRAGGPRGKVERDGLCPW